MTYGISSILILGKKVGTGCERGSLEEQWPLELSFSLWTTRKLLNTHVIRDLTTALGNNCLISLLRVLDTVQDSCKMYSP